MRPDVDRVAADIDVAVVERLQQLRQREAVGHELVEVDFQLVGFRLAAPTGDVDHTRHSSETTLQHPVLQSLEIEHAVAGRPYQAVAVNLTDRTGGRNLRLHVVGELRQLRQAIEHLLQRLVIGVVEGELQLYVGQPIEGNRADRAQIADACGLRLDWNGDIALDLLRGEPRTLRDDVDHRRRGIGVGLDVELLEAHEPADHRQRESDEHENAVLEREGDESIHGGF